MTGEKQESGGSETSARTSAGDASEVPPPPDGGFRAWAQVLAGHLVVAMSWGYAASYGVFQNYYEGMLPQTPSDISWIGGFQLFAMLFVSTISGRATDAGMAWEMVGLGGVLLVIGIFMASLAGEYWQIFLAQGLCVGIGQGLMWLPSVTVISTYFVRRRVVAVTIGATGTSTGGVIFPLMVQRLIPLVGFPWAVRCMGFVTLLMVVATLALLRPRLPPRKSGPLVEWTAFREPAYMLFTFGIFLLYWTLYFAFFYIQVYAVDVLGFSQTDGVNLIVVTNASGIFIRVVFGYVADRYVGPLNCLIPWVGLCCVLMFSWAGVNSVAGLYTFAVFFGLASAAAMGLFAGTVPSLTKDLNKIGTRVGMVLTLMSFGPLTGPPVAGALITQTRDSYLAAQIWAGSTLLLGVIVLVCARLITTGLVMRVKL